MAWTIISLANISCCQYATLISVSIPNHGTAVNCVLMAIRWVSAPQGEWNPSLALGARNSAYYLLETRSSRWLRLPNVDGRDPPHGSADREVLSQVDSNVSFRGRSQRALAAGSVSSSMLDWSIVKGPEGSTCGAFKLGNAFPETLGSGTLLRNVVSPGWRRHFGGLDPRAAGCRQQQNPSRADRRVRGCRAQFRLPHDTPSRGTGARDVTHSAVDSGQTSVAQRWTKRTRGEFVFTTTRNSMARQDSTEKCRPPGVSNATSLPDSNQPKAWHGGLVNSPDGFDYLPIRFMAFVLGGRHVAAVGLGFWSFVGIRWRARAQRRAETLSAVATGNSSRFSPPDPPQHAIPVLSDERELLHRGQVDPPLLRPTRNSEPKQLKKAVPKEEER